jgi:hypothetical protein
MATNFDGGATHGSEARLAFDERQLLRVELRERLQAGRQRARPR